MSKVISDIPSIKKELEKYYQSSIIPDISPLDFLHGLDTYINFVKSNRILENIILAMKEDYATETINVTKEAIHSKHARAYYDDFLGEDLGGMYPVFEYEKLIEAYDQFQKVKHLSTENEIKEFSFIMEEESPWTKGTITMSGSGLLSMTKYSYIKLLEPLHKFFIKQLDWVQDHGVFSKYLDYDEKEGILHFQGKEVKMNLKKVPTNAHYLLSYLFKNNPFEQHFRDELDDDKVLLGEKSAKSYYDACEDIKSKVEKITGISDFLDSNSGERMYVRLNPKYSLSKGL